MVGEKVWWDGGWMDGWMGGWVNGLKDVLRIAFSNKNRKAEA